jgi:hypothetical protein
LAPPTEEEKKNQNCHTIDGKLYYFHNNTKHWVPVNTSGTSSSGPLTTVANAAVANTVTFSVQADSVTPVTSNQTHDVAVANANAVSSSGTPVFNGTNNFAEFQWILFVNKFSNPSIH